MQSANKQLVLNTANLPKGIIMLFGIDCAAHGDAIVTHFRIACLCENRARQRHPRIQRGLNQIRSIQGNLEQVPVVSFLRISKNCGIRSGGKPQFL
jgi:hypothetical protein